MYTKVSMKKTEKTRKREVMEKKHSNYSDKYLDVILKSQYQKKRKRTRKISFLIIIYRVSIFS